MRLYVPVLKPAGVEMLQRTLWKMSRYMRRPQFIFRLTLYILGFLMIINIFIMKKTQSPHEKEKKAVGGKLTYESAMLLHYLSIHLDVSYRVLRNYGRHFSFSITLTNTGPTPISTPSWNLYFYQPTSILGMTSHGLVVTDDTIRIRHINGDLYCMEPWKDFSKLDSDQKLQIYLKGKGSIIAVTDVLPNWYVTVPGGRPMILKATAGESLAFVQPFDKPSNWKKGKRDKYRPFTPAERYLYNDYSDMGMAPLPVLPQPVSVRSRSDHLVIRDTWRVVAEPECFPEAEYLAEKLKLSFPVLTSAERAEWSAEKASDSGTPRSPHHYIELKLGPVPINSADPGLQMSEERYRLVAASNPVPGVEVTGLSRQGVFWGVQTLLALSREEGSEGMRVPVVEVVDAPRFPYRGFMLDVVRNFIPKEEVLRLLEVMAAYKLNKLHLHLSDDEAWRLDIPGLPELVKVGARRGHTLTESAFLLPQLGSGPQLTSGYYSTTDYRQILRHAKRHHIEVIPELDFPGHARAAIRAMLVRHTNMTSSGDIVGASEFLLSDMADTSKYISMQQFTDNVINPCLKSTYRFLKHVITELKNLHSGIMPLTSLHIGGDEIPLGALGMSPACGARDDLEVDVSQVIRSFQQGYVGLAADAGLSVQAWDDAFFGPGGLPVDQRQVTGTSEPPITLHTRHSRWDGGRAQRPIDLANSGYKVVHAAATYLFLDHAQEPDPAERGQHWATRFVDTRRVFSFAPLTYYNDVDVDQHGSTIRLNDVCGEGLKPCPTLDKPWNIIGMSGYMWTEMVRTVPQVHEMIFPRLLAVAERSWHGAPWELQADPTRRRQQRDADWTRFANTLGHRELQRLEDMGVEFYLPPPGAVTVSGIVKMNSQIPGLPIEYSADGGATWREGRETTAVPGLLMRTKSYGSTRTSRIIQL